MKEYAVKIDVTMTGTIYVQAFNEKEAEKLALNKTKNCVASDLRSFAYLSSEIVDIEEDE